MEKHFLDEIVEDLKERPKDESKESFSQPWYNAHGDCIMYKTAREAEVAERVDDLLTIYHSATERAQGL